MLIRLRVSMVVRNICIFRGYNVMIEFVLMLKFLDKKIFKVNLPSFLIVVKFKSIYLY